MKYFLRAFIAPIFFCLFFVFYPTFSFADSPQIIGFLLNGQAENVVFNPKQPGTTTIDIKVNMPVKFTRVYICSETQSCTGTSGNYTKYFSQTTLSDSLSKSWDGKKSDGTIAGEGIYRIMASMTPAGKTASTSTGQYTIKIDYSTLSTISSTSENTSTDMTTVENISSHTAIEELTSSEDDSVTTFVVGAGRERVAYAGSSVLFKANYKQLKSLGENKKFTWNFGDGYAGNGEEVYHSYRRAGEYNVVLNASAGNTHGSSRTKITILESNLKMDVLPNESVSLENLGNYEINIGDFKLRSNYREYSFPEDTIIGAGKKIIFDKECTKLSVADNGVTFLDPQNKELLSFKSTNNESEKIKTMEKEAISNNSDLSLRLEEKDITSIEEANRLVKVLTLENKKDISKRSFENLKMDNKSDEFENKVAQINYSEHNSQKVGFWQKIISFPITVFNGITGAFYEAN
jgi:hypothetical protein